MAGWEWGNLRRKNYGGETDKTITLLKIAAVHNTGYLPSMRPGCVRMTLLCRQLPCVFLGGVQWQPEREPEGAALAGFAAETDFAAHQFNQALAQGQTGASATVLAGHRDISLAETPEQHALNLWWNADAGVADFEADVASPGIAGQSLVAPADVAAVREFEGIAGQVADDFADTSSVAVQG